MFPTSKSGTCKAAKAVQSPHSLERRENMAREWLKKLRKAKKLTQVELASEMGISQHYYCAIENGVKKQELTLSMANKISEVLNVPLEYIVNCEAQRG